MWNGDSFRGSVSLQIESKMLCRWVYIYIYDENQWIFIRFSKGMPLSLNIKSSEGAEVKAGKTRESWYCWKWWEMCSVELGLKQLSLIFNMLHFIKSFDKLKLTKGKE